MLLICLNKFKLFSAVVVVGVAVAVDGCAIVITTGVIDCGGGADIVVGYIATVAGMLLSKNAGKVVDLFHFFDMGKLC